MNFKILILYFFLQNVVLTSGKMSIAISDGLLNKALKASQKWIISNVIQLKIEAEKKKNIVICSYHFSNVRITDLKFPSGLNIRSKDGMICAETEKIELFAKINAKWQFLFCNKNKEDFNLKAEAVKPRVCFKISLNQNRLFEVTCDQQNLIEIKSFDTTSSTNSEASLSFLAQAGSTISSSIQSEFNDFLKLQTTPLLNDFFKNFFQENLPKIPLMNTPKIYLDFRPSEIPIINQGIVYTSQGLVYPESRENTVWPLKNYKTNNFQSSYDLFFRVSEAVLNDGIKTLFENLSHLSYFYFSEKSSFADFDFTIEGFSKIFPGLEKYYKFKNQPTNLKIIIYKQPILKINEGNIIIFFYIMIEGIAVYDDEIKKTFISFPIECQTSLNIDFSVDSFFTLGSKQNQIIGLKNFKNSEIKAEPDIFNKILNDFIKHWLLRFQNSMNQYVKLVSSRISFTEVDLIFNNGVISIGANMDFFEIPVETQEVEQNVNFGQQKQQKRKLSKELLTNLIKNQIVQENTNQLIKI